MNKKKILIIEDEWNTIKGSFELANIFAFNNELIFENKIKSQDVDYNSFKTSYCAIFIDITLAKNSKWDGFNIIKKISESNLYPLEKIVVLTGNSKVEEKLKDMDIDVNALKVLYKPINFEMIATELQRLVN